MLNDERVKLLQAHAVAGDKHPAGTVVATDKSGWIIATGEGYSVVTIAQFPGARPMSIEALLNGRSQQMSPGNRLSIHASPDSSAQ
jgi:methionyl-tRNA formyltransferase